MRMSNIDIDKLKLSAKGRWDSIFLQLGINVGTGNYQPCPMCGGEDRFRYDNKDFVAVLKSKGRLIFTDNSDTPSYTDPYFKGGIYILDINNPVDPKYVGRYPTEDEPYNIEILGNYAYVANGENGLVVIDLADLSKPVYVSGYYTTNAKDVAIYSDSYAYVADSESGLLVIDISDPKDPRYVADTIIKKNELNWDAMAIAIKEDNAYLACDKGLVVFNIANPKKLEKSYEVPEEKTSYMVGMAISDKYVYVAYNEVGLVRIDISNPNNRLTLKDDDNRDVVLDDTNRDVALDDSYSYAYIANWRSGLKILKIDDSKAPVDAGEYNTVGYAQNIALCGNYAYIAFEKRGVVVMDVTYPDRAIEGITLATGGIAYDIAISGNYFYVANGDKGIVIADISDPTKPQIQYFGKCGDGDRWDARGVAIDGSNYLYECSSNFIKSAKIILTEKNDF